jgi:hypothetical protein
MWHSARPNIFVFIQILYKKGQRWTMVRRNVFATIFENILGHESIRDMGLFDENNQRSKIS